MGSSSSRNAVDSSSFSSSSSSPAEANEPRRSVGHQRFRSRCFRSSSKSPENSLNPAAHGEAFGWPIPLGSVHHVGEEADPQKYLSGKLKCIPKSSTNCNQICNKRLFRSVSHASTSSIQVYNAQEAEPSSSLKSKSSSRGESISANTSCSNDSHNSDIKLSRATSLGSAGFHSLFARRHRCKPSSFGQNTRSDNEHLINGTDQHIVQDNRPHNLCESRSRQQNVSSIQARFQEDADRPSGSLEWGNTFSESASIAETGNRNSQQHMTFSIDRPTVPVQNAFSVIHPLSVAESRDARRTHRRGTPENVESNVNFRRSRSVGRLRDRVLRRTSSSEGSFSIPQGDSMDREIRRHNGRRFWEALTRASSNRHAGTSSNVAQDQFLRTLRSMSASRRQREDRGEVNDRTSNNNSSILENRRLYLEERRRRARSQVHALQRLSSSFENLAGHERACILAGHHRTSRCSCQNVGRTDDSNTRASISRIIMLAEALFEVLDEIHHQSMALSSPSSVSSLGSFPAPDDIVESIPVRLYSKHDKNTNEDTAQCYICLVEYEEGDHVRVLPCHHEFHQLCVDKWLKEVHRVCPLCRGNVCDNSLRTPAGDL